MTKFEFIQEIAMRLISAWMSTPTSFNAEDVATAAKNVADAVWKYELENQLVPQHVLEEMGIEEEPENPRNDYDELRDEVENWHHMRWNYVTPVIEALTKNVKNVSLTCAKSLSLFYGHINKDDIKNALESGEIEGFVPETKPVQLTKWDYTLQRHVPDKIRQQRVGSYEVDRLSLILWLEKNYIRRTTKGTMIDKYIEKIIKGK